MGNIRLFAVVLTLAASAEAQTPPPNTGIELAENGHCVEAMPALKRTMARVTSKDQPKDQRKTAGIYLARCAMDLRVPDDAVSVLRTLTREFPGDPEVLFLAVHVYSRLSLSASQELLHRAPESPQVRELNAEALETQGRWDDAAKEYRIILEKDPNVPGIHFKMGRLILSQPKTPTTMEDARREFDAELKINPRNAAAEYVLGEIARQAEQWLDAIAHFTRAATLDPRFIDAQLGLGRALLASDRPADAIAPLEAAVKLQPDNPEPHFHLAIAYRRAGRKTDSDREALAQKTATEKANQTRDNLNRALTGTTAAPPQR
jgi:tetratricopeptide (TPR) repeat protein